MNRGYNLIQKDDGNLYRILGTEKKETEDGIKCFFILDPDPWNNMDDFKCDKCNEEFSDNYSLKDHNEEVHNSSN